MRHPARLASLAALVLSLALTAAAEETKKPSASAPGAAQPGPGGATMQTPKPDFQAWPSDQYIFVVNYGDKDYTGALDVAATCKSMAPSPPQDACGPNFPNGKFSNHLANFPAGHGNAPIKGSGNAQQISGAGWRAVFMGLPAGTFEIGVNVDPDNKVAEKDEANNKSTKTITIPGAARTGGVDSHIKLKPN